MSSKLREAVNSSNSCKCRNGPLCYKSELMIPFFITFLTCLSAFFGSRYNLALEILALRQQLGVLKRKRPHPRLRIQDPHVIVLNDAHLRRLIRDYISYYHADRIHDSLDKDTPAIRAVSSKPGPAARLVSLPRIGGLHHRYDWQQAA